MRPSFSVEVAGVIARVERCNLGVCGRRPGAQTGVSSGALAGPAFLFGRGTTFGRLGHLGLTIRGDLGAALLSNPSEELFPITLSLRIGLTYF